MREKVDPESKLNTFVSATPPKRRYRYRILVIPETEILAMTMKYTKSPQKVDPLQWTQLNWERI